MPRFLPVLLLAALLLSTPAHAEESFSAASEAYTAGIGKDLDAAARVKLVARVAAFDQRDAAKLLLESMQGLSDKLDGFLEELDRVEAQKDILDSESDKKEEIRETERLRAKRDRLEELIMAEREVVDRIEAAVAGFQSEPARGFVLTMVARGSTWRQRAIAARAAAGYEGEEARKAALRALKDKDVRVVIQALMGLKDRKDPETVAPIAKLLSHETWVVQVTAASALAGIGSTKAVRPLIEALGKTTGRVQDDINESLKKLTGQKFQPDFDQWKRWYEENKEEIEGEGAKGLRGGRKAKQPEDSSFYGITTRSKHIVYVLDISGSMNLEIGGKGVASPNPGDEEKASGPKIEIAKKELKRAIRQLAPDSKFTIIIFNEIVKVWKPKLIEAKQKNKNEAYIFINELEASGSTFTFGALKEAFKLAGMGAVDPHYESGVNTIFLLSDGMPTDQTFPMAKPMDTKKILKAVRQWNKLNKVVIHAIAIDPNTQGAKFIRFMKQLADENGGKYTERG
jgi:hypothetical protein